MKGNHLIIVYT